MATHPHKKRSKKTHFYRLAVGIIFLSLGIFLVWASTLKLPDVSSFNDRVISSAAKFYDRTGQIELFNLHQDVERTELPFNQISPYIKKATVSIEDAEFYQHHGIKPTSIIRAIFANITSLGYSQGGSTITQQVVKNSLLTKNKSISRKLKEWVLAIKLERVLSKDEILNIYLNDSPYGGNVYGVEVASQTFFKKSAHDLTLAEAAYLASLPQAPSYYSPYGNHKEELDKRKNLVLSKMLEQKYITKDEYNAALAEKVTFYPPNHSGSLAPHFVFYLRDLLATKYGEQALNEDGLKIITTIDANLQQKAEEIVKKYALSNKEKFDAENAGLVSINPKTGQILAMVGSRDYFDKDIDGNVNITFAKRQPGSSFKPFVYATAFKKGYTPETTLFDVKTEFSTYCTPDSKPLKPGAVCYSPNNYDNQFRGPVTLREALGQSLNVVAVKVLYLAGVDNALQTAKDMGITTLTDKDRYGLTLVLGGGEVTLLELTNAYGAFANDGVKNPYTGILKITDDNNTTLEEYEQQDSVGIDSNIARTISDMLSDNDARTPTFGERSALYFPGNQVAVKTGTTNDYRDAWVVGYTPSFVTGAWAGNNNNRPMQKKVAGQVVAPMWHEYMAYALQTLPNERFKQPEATDKTKLPPVLRGIWQGGESYFIDSQTGNRATDSTTLENRKEVVVPNIHSILYWVDKDNPTSGIRPTNPESDPQFAYWESAVVRYANEHNLATGGVLGVDTTIPAISTSSFEINGFDEKAIHPYSQAISFTVKGSGLSKVDVYVNNRFYGSLSQEPFYFSLLPRNITGVLGEKNSLKIVSFDTSFVSTEKEFPLLIDLAH
jgi:1A family penicillin-binding protein